MGGEEGKRGGEGEINRYAETVAKYGLDSRKGVRQRGGRGGQSQEGDLGESGRGGGRPPAARQGLGGRRKGKGRGGRGRGRCGGGG